MKKTKSLLAFVLAAMLLVMSVPLSAFVAGAAAPEDNYVILNDGSDQSTITVGSNFFTDPSSTEIGSSPDGTHFNLHFHETVGYNQWANMKIALNSAGPLTGSKPALVYYVDFSNIANVGAKPVGWKHALLDSEGTEIAGAITDWQTCYYISVKDGTITNDVHQSEYWGLKIPGGFVGYIVVPLQLGSEYDYSQAKSLQLSQSDSPLDDDPDDAGKSYILDNFAFVKDVDAFLNDTALGSLGLLPPSATASRPEVSTADGTATVAVASVEGATSYDVNVYTADSKFVTSVAAVDGNATVSLDGMGEKGYLQVVAHLADGKFAASRYVSLPVLESNEVYDLLADGNGDITTTFTAAAELDTVRLPDGHGMSAVTTKGQYFEFKFDGEASLRDYQALAMYVDYADDAYNNFVWNGLKTTSGAFLTGRLETADITGGQYVYGISAVDGSIVKFASSEHDCIKMAKGFTGWIVFTLNAGKAPVVETASALRLYANGWHENNTPANLNFPIYVDNFVGIKDADAFRQLVAEDPTSFGYLPASVNDKPAVTQAEEGDNVNLTLSWDAVAGASNYRVYVYSVAADGKPTVLSNDLVAEATYTYTAQAGVKYAFQVVADDSASTVLLPVVVSSGTAVAPDYLIANDGSDEGRVYNGNTSNGLTSHGGNTFENISAIRTPAGVDNSTYRMWGTWDWSTFRADIATDYALEDVKAYAFWVDMSNVTLNNFCARLSLIDKEGNTLNNILAGEMNAHANNYLVNAKTGEVTTVESWNDNAVSIPKGFVGWVITPVRDTAEAQALDFNNVAQLMVARSGSVGTKEEHANIDFDNFTVITNYAEFYSVMKKLYKFGAMTAGAYNEEGVAVANPALTVNAGSAVTYTWDTMYDSKDKSAAKYLVNEYKVEGANYTLVKTTETEATSYTTSASSDTMIQVVGLSKASGRAGTIVGATTRAQGIGADLRPTVLGGTFNSKMQIRFKALTPETLLYGATDTEFGMLMLPTQLLNEAELTASTSQVLKASSANEMQAAANYSASIAGSELKGNTGVRISARAYVKVTDLYGSSYTIYSADTLSKSVNGMARAMVTAVLGSEEAKALVTEWTEAVPNTTTADDVAQTDPPLISGYDLAQFALLNPDAVAKAAELNAQ